MKTESEIRDCIAILRAFALGEGAEIQAHALLWVLGEYPPQPRERPAPPPPAPHIAQPMGPGGFAVRNFPNMRTNKEGE